MSTFPRAHGDAVCSATIRTTPEDFFVEEIASFEPSGAGEHLLLTVEKRGMNTAFAAKRIAAWAGVAESAIGYAGLKDRHAVTRQRFSVWLPKKIAPDIAALRHEMAERAQRNHPWGHDQSPGDDLGRPGNHRADGARGSLINSRLPTANSRLS